MRYLKLLVAIAAAVLALTVVAQTAATAAKAPKPATGSVKVCKVAAPPLAGDSFPFQTATWSGADYNLLSLTAGPAPGGCATVGPFTVGTILLVEEASTPGVPYPGVTPTFSLSSGTLAGSVPSMDLVAVTVTAGTTTLTVTDTPTTPPQAGTLELCKTAADKYVSGSFTFDLTGPGSFSQTVSVPAGQCNEYPVPSGAIGITEPPEFPYALSSVSAIPSSALLSSDLDTQSASVDVEPGATTTAFFTNSTLTGTAKVCKTLARSADDVLAGQTFTYSVSATFNGVSIPVPGVVSVVAQDYPTQTCAFVGGTNKPKALPLGTLVTFTETGLPADGHIQSVGTSVSPSNLNAGSTSSTTQSLYVGNLPAPNNVGSFGAGSVTQANFINEAFGTVEVCKTSSSINTGTPFQFTVAGAAIPPVEVGFCSPGVLLPIGTTTITETPQSHITLQSVTATTGAVSQSGNSATVTVPFNSDNIVTFDNEINSGTLKICKAQTSSDAGLQGQTFNLGYSYTVDGTTTSGTDPLMPGQCARALNNVPVLNSDLTPVTVSITESTTAIANVGLFSVGVVGPDTVVSSPAPPTHLLSAGQGGTAATEVLNSLEGVTTVTFVNGIDIPPAG